MRKPFVVESKAGCSSDYCPSDPQAEAPASSRRQWLTGLSGLVGFGAASLVGAWPGLAMAATEQKRVIKRIPVSGELIAPVGMGTWITFNVGRDPAVRDQRAQVLDTFFASGGGMIDSSPMYGSAQEVLGDLLTRMPTPPGPDKLFSATKVWTGDSGREQVRQAHDLWRLKRFDLLQVHNLLNWREHLAMLREMKSAGRLRYLGVTTSHGRRHADLEQIMRTEQLDFVQLTYNAVDREAERRLLPLAQDEGIAVIVNRPFQRGALPQRLVGQPLPPVAAELGCETWAELLLKYIVAMPSVTCVIPATSRVDHMVQNMRAGTGVMPDSGQRRAIERAVQSA